MKYLDKMIKFLGIKHKVELRIRRKNKNIRNAAACYEGLYVGVKLVSHRITINGNSILDPDEQRNIKTLIAHELVHAWQEEYRVKGKAHGKRFARKAAYMNMKFRVPNIYRPDFDID